MDDRDSVSSSRIISGSDPGFKDVLDRIRRLASVRATLLICGETGTGKELCAREIHQISQRAKRPFVAINCGAVPADLLENELFGHEAGAFTNAASRYEGIVRQAEGGTLFLDEIDGLATMAQVKLLRFLQDKEYRPLGSSRAIAANVRVIAATNVDLEQAVGDGSFRGDLYYRLSVLTLNVPPLRERRSDIPALVHFMLRKQAAELEVSAPTITPEALSLLCRYEWPGNVRQLESVILRAIVSAENGVVASTDVGVLTDGATHKSFREAKAQAVKRFEVAYIQGLLVAYQGNVSRAAAAAGKNRRALWQLIRKHQIKLEPFRMTSPRVRAS